jgi:multidrug efflux system membrane fusion protein
MEKVRAGERLRVDVYDREGFESGRPKLATGWLATVDNQIDPTTGMVKLRANFDNRDGRLFPNQFVNARLLVEDKQDVTLIPTATVQRNAQATYVWLVKPDSSVTVRTITTGTTEGDTTEVTSGLVPGDAVVMTGVDRLQEGSKVRIPNSPERSPKARS